MKRSCTELPIQEYLEELRISNDRNVSFYIDNEDPKKYNEILSFINNNRDKFRNILYVIITGKHNKDLYGKESCGSGTENITAMKFKGKSLNNSRIYCKEFHENGKNVIMITMLPKKFQRNKESKKLTDRLKIIGEYDYEYK